MWHVVQHTDPGVQAGVIPCVRIVHGAVGLREGLSLLSEAIVDLKKPLNWHYRLLVVSV
jgi:hypothetical protein